MKNRNKLFALISMLALVLLLATSCYSTIGLRTLVPAEVNVAGYKTIAVSSTTYDYTFSDIIWRNRYIPVKGYVDPIYYQYLNAFTLYDNSTSKEVCDYSSRNLANALDKGFFTVVGPELTDALIMVGKNTGSVRQTLINNNVDALLTSKISSMYYDEYIISEPIYGTSSSTDTSSSSSSSTTSSSSNNTTIVGYNFYIIQNASISLTYTVVDVEDNVMIANKTQSVSSGDLKTLIGHTDPANIKNFIPDTIVYEYFSATDIFKTLLNQFFSNVTNQLTPHYEYSYFDMMANKPKKESVKAAYDYVDSGNYRTALELFVQEYNTSGHVPSGYNAAVLYYALGQYEEAFNLAWDVYNKSGNSDALDLYYTLKNIKDKQDAAIAQINGTKSSTSTSDELIGF